MTDDNELQRAFQGLAASADSPCSAEDLDRVWRAVAGELRAEERRMLVERLPGDPALAEAWRAAHALQQAAPITAPSASRTAWRPAVSWLAAAAVLVLASSIVFVVARRDRPDASPTRDAGGTRIESLTSGAALPREAFRLRWRGGPAGARYQLRVTTEDLRVLTTVTGLTQPEAAIDSAVLADLAPGSRVFWQVEALLPGGERTTSETFVTRVQ